MSSDSQEHKATNLEPRTNDLTNGNGSNRFTLGKFCIDEARPIKVIVIGAGYSGTSWSRIDHFTCDNDVSRYRSWNQVSAIFRLC